MIGISVATFRNGQNLNFAIPSNYLRALATQVEIAKPLSHTKSTKLRRSILTDHGGRSVEGVTGGKFRWGGYGNYSFSLRNRLREKVKDVHYLVIFYDFEGDPIDVHEKQYKEVIHAGLAKRSYGHVSDGVKDLSTRWNAEKRETETRVEFRVLNFEIVE